jgi:hypothetical protein
LPRRPAQPDEQGAEDPTTHLQTMKTKTPMRDPTKWYVKKKKKKKKGTEKTTKTQSH